MKQYYDVKKGSMFGEAEAAKDISQWKDRTAEYPCFIHPNGFCVFLSAEEIERSDEYKENDPYKVIENLQSNFQQRRLNSTLELLKDSDKSKSLKVLDLGCGQGHITDRIKKDYPNYDVYGLDYAISAIEYAHAQFPGIDFVVANAYTPPYPDHYFDIVVLNNIWEHVPDPLNLLQSISRIQKPGGQLIISTPSRYRFLNLVRVLIGKKPKFMSKLHVTEYSVGQVKEQLSFGGYDVDKVFSPAIREQRFVFRVLKSIMLFCLKLLKSDHVLESTVFYSARKRKA